MKNIIFDFGGVILNLDVSATLRAFDELGIKDIANSTGHYYRDPVFNQYEIGAVSDQEFRNVVKTLSNQPLTDDQIDQAWTKMLQDIPKDRVDFILELKKSYRIFLLSNTNHIHQLRFEPYFEKLYGFPFSGLFERIYYSHDEGIRKPDSEAFTNVLEKSELIASESLFIDDSLENIKTADRVGMKTHHIQPGYQLQDILNSI
jgi:HAD superfamily hydrolase (TIGR01509 family)